MSRILYQLLTDLARLAVRSGRSKDRELIVLRHQNAVLRRQIGRPALTDDDRTLLGSIDAALPRRLRNGRVVTPETPLRWHRQRIAKHWTQPTARRPVGHPSTLSCVSWSCALLARTHVGTPAYPGRTRAARAYDRQDHRVAGPHRQLYRPIPEPIQSVLERVLALTSRSRLRLLHRRHCTLTPLLRPVLHQGRTRDVFYAGVTAKPLAPGPPKLPRTCSSATGSVSMVPGHWFAIAVVSLLTSLTRSSAPTASRFSPRRSIRQSPMRSPSAGSDQSAELLDRTIIWNQRQERLVVDYIAHYNRHRPHQSLAQEPPTPVHHPPDAMSAAISMLRNSRCDGLIHEYRNAA